MCAIYSFLQVDKILLFFARRRSRQLALSLFLERSAGEQAFDVGVDVGQAIGQFSGGEFDFLDEFGLGRVADQGGDDARRVVASDASDATAAVDVVAHVGRHVVVDDVVGVTRVQSARDDVGAAKHQLAAVGEVLVAILAQVVAHGAVQVDALDAVLVEEERHPVAALRLVAEDDDGQLPLRVLLNQFEQLGRLVQVRQAQELLRHVRHQTVQVLRRYLDETVER